MLREQILKSVKIAVGVVVALLLAQALRMEFSSSVATIVIVSMLSAKKQSIKLAGIRLLVAVVSLALSSVLFLVLGFSLPVFALYILIFTFLMYKFDLKIAIVLNVVLVMHVYSLEQVSFAILLNEFGLMFLGVVVALAVNFFTLDIEGELIAYQSRTDALYDAIFKNMGKCLVNECRTDEVSADLEKLDTLLSHARERAYKYMNSYYIQENNYYVEFFLMRRQQFHIVKTMQSFLTLDFLKKSEVEMLKSFTDDFVNNTKAINTCQSQIVRLDEIKHHFTHEAELPASHKQLQNRIALNQYLFSLESLVSVKMRFIARHEM